MTAKGKSLGYHETTGRRWRSSRTLANTHSSVGGGDLKGYPLPPGVHRRPRAVATSGVSSTISPLTGDSWLPAVTNP